MKEETIWGDENCNNYFPLSSKAKQKNFNDLFFKIRELKNEDEKRDVFMKCFFKNKAINLGQKIVDDPYNCNKCAFMDWPASLKQKRIICGGNGLKIKKGKCINLSYGKIENACDDIAFSKRYIFFIIFIAIPA